MFLKVSETQNVVTLCLNRPDVRNAFNGDLISDLTKAFLDISVRKDIRAVILRGEGKAFCAGADLQMMQEMVKFSIQENQSDAGALFQMFEAMNSCPHPILAVVHGAAYGGALGLIACADIAICEETTQFAFSEVKLGISPAVISTFILKKISLRDVTPWMISGRSFNALQAKGTGLIHEVVPMTKLEETLQMWITSFLEAGPEAVRETKKLIAKIPLLNSKDAEKEAIRVISERRVSPEGQEGLKSFLEKRSPKWKPKG